MADGKKVTGLKLILEIAAIGDYIGGTTVAFLTVANVMFFLRTVSLQKIQLEKANEQYLASDKMVKQQQFESQFYNLLELLKDSRLERTTIDGVEMSNLQIELEKLRTSQLASQVELQKKWLKSYVETHRNIDTIWEVERFFKSGTQDKEAFIQMYNALDSFEQSDYYSEHSLERYIDGNFIQQLNIHNALHKPMNEFEQSFAAFLQELQFFSYIQDCTNSILNESLKDFIQVYELIEHHLQQFIEKLYTYQIFTDEQIKEELQFYNNLLYIHAKEEQLFIQYNKIMEGSVAK